MEKKYYLTKKIQNRIQPDIDENINENKYTPSEKLIPKEKYVDILLSILKNDKFEGYFYMNLYETKPIEDQKKIFSIINCEIKKILSKYKNNNRITKFKNTYDSVVIVFENIVVRIFNYELIYRKNYSDLYLILYNEKKDFLEEIYMFYKVDDFYFIISKAIRNDVIKYINKEQLINNITEAITFLMNNNWNHMDININNIGYDNDKQSYVLFDFGNAQKNKLYTELNKKYLKDIYDLNECIKSL